MKNNLNLTENGYAYFIRPVKLTDAKLIIDLRLEDETRNKFIHKISNDVSVQEKWINDYLKKDNDFYFVLENKITSTPEGLISLYNIDFDNKTAEWGRWVIKKNSLGAIESVNLIMNIAFNKLGLDKIYSRTIEDNTSVVSFHDSIGEIRNKTLENYFEMDNNFYNAIEHYVTKEHYFEKIESVLSQKSFMIFERLMKQHLGIFEFHHIGVATNNIIKEFDFYKILGYQKDGEEFSDNTQGIKGLFIKAKGQPSLELLENIPGSKTLTPWINKGIKMYHFAYYVKNFDKAIEIFLKNKAKIVSTPEKSIAFGQRICFLILPNMFMFELIEKS